MSSSLSSGGNDCARASNSCHSYVGTLFLSSSLLEPFAICNMFCNVSILLGCLLLVKCVITIVLVIDVFAVFRLLILKSSSSPSVNLRTFLVLNSRIILLVPIPPLNCGFPFLPPGLLYNRNVNQD